MCLDSLCAQLSVNHVCTFSQRSEEARAETVYNCELPCGWYESNSGIMVMKQETLNTESWLPHQSQSFLLWKLYGKAV